MNLFKNSLILIFLMVTVDALGNGGPVDWTPATAAGDIRPLQQQNVALEKEGLKIVLDLKTYSIEASYTLISETRKKVTFGIPIIWQEEPVIDDDKPHPNKDYKEEYKKIKLKLNDKKVSCTPKLLQKPKKLSDYLVPLSYNGSPSSIPARAWCLAELNLAKGDNFLNMNYTANYWFIDSEFSKSPISRFDPRILYYPLSPAGFWKGLVSELSIEIDLGPYREFETIDKSPFKLNKSGHLLTGTDKNLDLKSTSPIALSLAPNPAAKNQLIHWNSLKHKEHARIMAIPKASSTLKGNYDAKNLFDGDPKTAWCEGKAGTGKGEWVEFEIPADFKTSEYCRFQGVILTQGYLKHQESFENNERLKEVSFTECEERKPMATAKFDDIERYDLAAKEIKISAYQNPDATGFFAKLDMNLSACLRLNIDDVYPGEKFEDTCLSEVAFLLNCS